MKSKWLRETKHILGILGEQEPEVYQYMLYDVNALYSDLYAEDSWPWLQAWRRLNQKTLKKVPANMVCNIFLDA